MRYALTLLAVFLSATLVAQTEQPRIDFDAKTAFGDLAVESKTPLVQIDAVYGLQELEVETFSATGGAVTVVDTGTGREWECSTGTSVGGYGLVRSKAALRYRPGEGVLGRGTARFDTPVANSRQSFGFVASGTELSFGYNGTSFGVLHRRGGRLEIQTLTVSSAASGGETATVTLDGDDTNVSLTGGGDTVQDAREIAATSFTGYQTQHVGSTVVFISQSVGEETGSFTYSSSTSAGTFAETQNGRAVTDTFVDQSSWNLWTAPDLDPTKGNVYQIQYQYLGYGAITFSLEEPNTGRIIPVHTIRYANANTSPSLLNPSMKIGVFAASLGSTTDLDVYSASMAAFVEGSKNFQRPPAFVDNSVSSVGTSLTPIISIKNSLVFNDFIHLGELIPISLSVAAEGTKPVEIEVWANATLTGPTNWQYAEGSDSSPLLVDTASTGLTTTTARKVYSAALSKTGDVRFDFTRSASNPLFKLYRGDTLTVAARATSGTSDITASIGVMEE